MFKRIVAAAALAGVLAGLLLTAIQQFEIAPLIRAAETREAVNAGPQSAQQSAAFEHAHEAWAPRDGGERLISAAVANIVLATAFALLLGAAMSLRRRFGWRAGLVWGIAGYAVFFVAPALGVPPSLPGTESAPLADRQLWWVGTASCSAAGLWLAAFAARAPLRVLGLAMIVAPHVVGAPQPPDGAGNDAQAFLRATYLANAALWMALGVVVGALGKPGKSLGVVGGRQASRAAKRPAR